MIVEFSSGGSYAPCMVIVSARSRIWRDRIIDHLESMGQEQEDGTVLISYEQAEELLPPAKYRDMDEGWNVAIRMDTWTALHLWGYDTHKLAEGK